MDDLRIYQSALELVTKVYVLTNNESKLKNDFSLKDQLRRAAVSIPANIAEGFCRSKKQFGNYLQIASGSSNELIALLTVVENVYSIPTEELRNEFRLLGKQIIAFSKSLQNSRS